MVACRLICGGLILFSGIEGASSCKSAIAAKGGRFDNTVIELDRACFSQVLIKIQDRVGKIFRRMFLAIFPQKHDLFV